MKTNHDNYFKQISDSAVLIPTAPASSMDAQAITNPPIQHTSANASAAHNRGSACSRDLKPGHQQDEQQPQDAAQCQHQQHEQLQQLGTSPSACHCQPSHLMQKQHSGRIPAHATGSPAGAARLVASIGIRPSSALDRVLAGQGTVEVRQRHLRALRFWHDPTGVVCRRTVWTPI